MYFSQLVTLTFCGCLHYWNKWKIFPLDRFCYMLKKGIGSLCLENFEFIKNIVIFVRSWISQYPWHKTCCRARQILPTNQFLSQYLNPVQSYGNLVVFWHIPAVSGNFRPFSVIFGRFWQLLVAFKRCFMLTSGIKKLKSIFQSSTKLWTNIGFVWTCCSVGHLQFHDLEKNLALYLRYCIHSYNFKLIHPWVL